MTRFAWGVSSDVGRVRAINQDSAAARDGLFVVADGMGGHRGGEVAADIAVTVISDDKAIVSTADLIAAVHHANQSIMMAAADDPALEGMGTTLCALALVDVEGRQRLAVANVGDSRIYVLRPDAAELQQLTEDHSLVAQLVREGSISAAEAERHPQRNVLTRALGIDFGVSVDAWEIAPEPGDRFVLCSDGLYNEVSNDQIAAVLRRLASPADAASELTRLANEGGGRDNITVVVVDVVGADATAPVSNAVRGLLAKQAVPDVAGFDTTQPEPVVDDGPQTIIGTVPAAAAAPPADVVVPPPGRGFDEPPVVEIREPRPPLFTVRTAFFGFGVILIVLAAFAGVLWMKEHSYTVRFDDAGHVTIYRDRVAWYGEAVLETDPDLTRELLAATAATSIDELEKGHSAKSKQSARAYVESLRQAVKRVQAVVSPTTTSSTTTTTAPVLPTAPVTTTAFPAPTR